MSNNKITKITPSYTQNIFFTSNNRRVRRKPPKLCPDCKETSDSIKVPSSKVPCEMEYDSSKFTLENLQKLVIFTTQNCDNNNGNNKHSSSIYPKSSIPSVTSTSSND
ncbi:hypothetical protein RhiirA5_432277 [Rhizophagus irregularis]|uniref:Uncharacterized protein n=1 Tax=Rhizophagus irregularis TaxID=588596 RepID=A0A2I1EPL2_9GLOM|nr:hypothetical protein RhiirA5_432277 [Rhizophagus irregularis]PKY24054.1 hypothetical protein RhiirB3_438474 [Rhizophagus irregularis]CAB5383270.1 unnamed protein product [Rhizophagus irregularis]